MISVMIPVYNVAPWLDTCIASVIDQDYADFELLLLYGESTDDSTEICRKWAAKDPRIRLIAQERHGLGAARMQGVREAKGDYLAFVDGDDYVEPDYLSWLYETAVSHGTDFVECAFFEEHEDGSTQTASNARLANLLGTEYADIYGLPAVWKRLIRKELWEKAAIDTTSVMYAEDLAVYHLLLSSSRHPVFTERPLYHYRIRTGSLSTDENKATERIHHLAVNYEAIFAASRVRGIFERDRNTLLRQAETQLLNALSHHAPELSPALYKEQLLSIRSFLKAHFNDVWTTTESTYFALGSPVLKQVGNQLCRDLYTINNALSPVSLSDLQNSEMRDAFWTAVRQTAPDILLMDLTGEATTADDIGKEALLERFSAACGSFLSDLAAYRKSHPCQVFLVKNLLYDYRLTPSGWKTAAHKDDIARINRYLLHCYDKFLENAKDVSVVDVLPEKLRYVEAPETDTPAWNANSSAALYLTEQIAPILRNPVYSAPAYTDLISSLDRETLMLFPAEDLSDSRTVPSADAVCCISHELSRTGAPLALLGLTAALLRRGKTVFVLCKEEGPLLQDFLSQGCTVILYPAYQTDLEWLTSLTFYFDTFFCNTLLTMPAVNALAPAAKRLYWWIHESGYAFLEELKKYRIQGTGLRYLAAGAPVVTAIKEYFGAEALLFPYYVETVPQPVSDNLLATGAEHLSQTVSRVHFLQAGTVDTNKGQQLLVKAIRLLPQEIRKNCDFTFVTTNNRDYNETIYTEMTVLAEKSENVHILDAMSREDFYALMNRMDVIIVPSYQETNSVVAAEALMLQKLLIISDSTGNCYWLRDHENALLFSRGDAAHLCSVITEAALKYASFDMIRANGNRLYQEIYSPDAFAARLDSILC